MLKFRNSFRISPPQLAAAAAVVAVIIGSAGHAEHKVGITPPFDMERTASVGSPIIERFSYDMKLAAIPKADMVQHLLWAKYEIPAGTPLTSEHSKAKFKGCIEPSGTCALDDDGDGMFDRIAQDFSSAAVLLPAPVPYEIKEIVNPAADNFKQVISYTGATSDTLRFSYREFSNDFARLAFTEELALPLGKTFPQRIALKDFKITVLSVDGMGMRYMIER